MLSTTENALERLVALVGEHSDLNGAQVLDLWAKELTQERQKQEARRTALADEALYYVARIESQPTLNEQLQEVSLQPRKVERLAIKYSDLPRFAKSRGIPYPDLMDLLELRVGELVDHWGARWVQDHPRSMYIDRSARE